MQLFTRLSVDCSEVFGATSVCIWENNFFSNTLLRQAAYPPDHYAEVPRTVHRSESLAYDAVRDNEVVCHQIEASYSGHEIPCGETAGKLVSIPVPCWFDPQLTIMVISLYFKDRAPSTRISTAEADWLVQCVSMAVDAMVFELHDSVRRYVDLEVRDLAAISSIHRRIAPELRRTTACNSSAMLSYPE